MGLVPVEIVVGRESTLGRAHQFQQFATRAFPSLVARGDLDEELAHHGVHRSFPLRRDNPRLVQHLVIDGKRDVFHAPLHSYTYTVYSVWGQGSKIRAPPRRRRRILASPDAADGLRLVRDRVTRTEYVVLAGDAMSDDACETDMEISRETRSPRSQTGFGASEAKLASLGPHRGVPALNQSDFFTALTTFCAASSKSSAGITLSPLSRMIFLPSSTLVPSSRTTSGAFRPTSFTAAITPSAITSQRMMPPKMLTRMPFTCGSAVMILNAAVTFSLVAPPPTSRKLAGLSP